MLALWSDMVAWWHTVTPEFAFLLALPFLVAVAAFLGECIRKRRAQRASLR